jgi:hypothetical protein
MESFTDPAQHFNLGIPFYWIDVYLFMPVFPFGRNYHKACPAKLIACSGALFSPCGRTISNTH